MRVCCDLSPRWKVSSDSTGGWYKTWLKLLCIAMQCSLVSWFCLFLLMKLSITQLTYSCLVKVYFYRNFMNKLLKRDLVGNITKEFSPLTGNVKMFLSNAFFWIIIWPFLLSSFVIKWLLEPWVVSPTSCFSRFSLMPNSFVLFAIFSFILLPSSYLFPIPVW